MLLNPQGEGHPLVKKSISSTSGLDSLRGKLQAEGVSEKAPNLITDSRREGTKSHYESSWRKWSSWCSKKQIDPFRSPITFVLEFLSDLFDQGLEYQTNAGYRSALSAYHDPIEGTPVGKHPLVSSLLTDVFNKRCPRPKYTFIWDVEKVIKFLSSLKAENISDKMLTLKLTLLLALTLSARSHEICCLDIRYLVKHYTGYTFHFGEITKTARKGKLRSPIKLSQFKENKELCVCNYIDLYLDRSSSSSIYFTLN